MDIWLLVRPHLQRIHIYLKMGKRVQSAMRTLSHCMICAHVHDELIIECREDASLDAICEQMGRTPPWANGLILRADGYETPFYKKD